MRSRRWSRCWCRCWCRSRSRSVLSLRSLYSRSNRLVTTRSSEVVNNSLDEVDRVWPSYLESLSILHNNCHRPSKDFVLLNPQLVQNSVMLRMDNVELVVEYISGQICVGFDCIVLSISSSVKLFLTVIVMLHGLIPCRLKVD